MIHRILLSILSVGMVANCIQAAQDEQLPYFQFRKGISFNKRNTARFRPLFWPAWAPQTTCSANDAATAAFIQRTQELSENSHTAAKEGAVKGFTIGGIGGAVIGALAAGILGFRGIHMPGRERPAEHKNLNYYGGCILKKFLQIVAGAALGAATGGTITAAITAPIKVYESLDRPSGYCWRYLEGYCDDAQQHALNKLKDAPGISPAAKAIIEKLYYAKYTRDKVTLSDEENRVLDESTLAFGSTALFEEEQMIEPCIKTASIAQILQEFQNTDKRHCERISAITHGSELASAYARRNKWRTFMPTGKNISTLTRLFNEFNAEEQRVTDYRNMKYTYTDVSDLVEQLDVPDSEQTTELREQIVKKAAEFEQMYRSYNNLPAADRTSI